MIKREILEEKQILVYIITIIVSVFIGLNMHKSMLLQYAIEPVIGILLYSMFCQLPFLAIRETFRNRSFFVALLTANFIVIPLFVWLLISLFPVSPVIALGVLMVLLTPCIDYVIVFTHLGKGDSRSVLAATPLLFILQLLLLPFYFWLFKGDDYIGIIQAGPFAKAFIYLIVLPFILALCTQLAAQSPGSAGKKILHFSGWLPVPFMALTFFVIIASQVGTLFHNFTAIIAVLPLYTAFAIGAPFIGLLVAKFFRLTASGKRAVAFSASTRNSLVVLPLALSLPAPHNQLVAVVIVTQTITELLFELIYIKVIPLLTPNDKEC